MKKVIALLGDYYHQEANISPALNHALLKLKNEGEQMEVEYIKAEQLTEKLQEHPDIVVLYKANRLNPTEEKPRYWMCEKLEEKICQYVKQGGSWFVWHSGLSSYENFKKYYEMVQGKFDFHPSEHQHVSYQPTGEVTTIRNQFSMVDEHYFVTCDESNTDVFLRAVSAKGNTVAGWTHAYGMGRVVCLTPAHNKEELVSNEMVDLLAKSLKLSYL
ncbi:ThuA domain-containing protein [Metabacillus litoralis]|nr:ThuA domain-containing protein [Metabacillus litoralis]